MGKKMDFFAATGNVKLSRYQISRDDGGGWHSIYVDLSVDPFFHRYVKIVDETVVHNSHGTDVDDYHNEYVVTPDEAVNLLRKANSSAADLLAHFEGSCGRIYKKCADLVREHFAGCEPQGMLYNSENSTLIRVRNSDDTESAIKICRMTEEDFEKVHRFRVRLEKTGGDSHIVKTEKILRLPVEGHKSSFPAIFSKHLPEQKRECLVIIKMPLMLPAYSRSFHSRNGYVGYKKTTGKEVSEFEFQSGLQTAKALAAIHALGYVHHDVRPENILTDGEGHFVLGDIESVRPLADQYEGHFQSSLQYRAPELEKRLPYGADVDVFAWGRSMVYILSAAPAQGKKPEEIRINLMDGGRTMYLSQGRGFNGITVTLHRYQGKKISLAQAAVKAVSENPAERWRDGEELAKALGI